MNIEKTLKIPSNVNFIDFNNKLKEKFNEIQSTCFLFKSSINGDLLWERYINSFRKGDDPVFRDPESSWHTCNNDKNFIRRYGNVVGINSKFEIVTMFDVDLPNDSIYFDPANNLSKSIKKNKIENVFFETFNTLNELPYEKINKNLPKYQLGHSPSLVMYDDEKAKKFGVVEVGKIYEFNHYHVSLDRKFVNFGDKSIETIQHNFKDFKEVFKKGLDELPLDTLELVRDLINQGSLLNGNTYLPKVLDFIKYKKEYDKIPANLKDNYTWVKSYNLPTAKFKGELIGELCSDLAEGMDINKACITWNKRVDPVNYMVAKAPFTQKQLDEFDKFIEKNGYKESFDRRYAVLDDIDINQILHANFGDGKVKNASIFTDIKATKPTRHKKSEFNNIEEVSIEKFMTEILPNVTSMEAYFENRLEGNLTSLFTSKDKLSKGLFKWNNNFGWTTKGNLAGKSQIKEEVKSKGGRVDGVLRSSMLWADGNTDNSDLDLHCIEPDRNEIYWKNNRSIKTSGNLDIDIRTPNGSLAVENITFPRLSSMIDGDYLFFVRQFSARNSKGFKAEIEFGDEVYTYEYDRPVSGDVKLAKVTLKNGVFTIEHLLKPTTGTYVSSEIYGIETNNFHKVNLVCESPNYWGENNIGHKHYFFMLENCKADQPLRTFHNEFLNNELVPYRRILEVVADKKMIEPAEKQLSGLGFNSTVKDNLIVKLNGSFKRTIRINFNN